MSQVMISLVSGQRMQNIIPVFQNGIDIESLWLVRSTDADEPTSPFARALRDTLDCLQADVDVHSAEPPVGAYGIEETRRLVKALIQKESWDGTVVNFTGGTKCMSIGAYLAARDAGVIALYVDTANEKLVWFEPNGKVCEEEFDLARRLTVDIYLRANGQQVDTERSRRVALPKKACAAARELLSHWPSCRETLEAFGNAVSQGRESVSAEEIDREIASILEQYGLVQLAQGDWHATQQGRPFLTGKWLDAIVYTLLKDSGLFDDVQLELCLRGVKNELDVLATRKGQMAIVECKSGSLGGQTTLNKLQAIRTRFGTFARTFFVTSRDADRVDETFSNRAREYRVREIVAAESLLKVAEIVRERMRGVP